MEFALPLASYLEEYRYKYLAIYYAIRDAILEGRLTSGTKLPSTRYVADLYHISRGSVAQSYDMLLAEGYVQMTVGKGTFVAHAGPSPDSKKQELVSADITLSYWGNRIMSQPRSLKKYVEQDNKISFLLEGMPMESFPYDEWRSALNHAGGKSGKNLSIASSPAGDAELREAIATYLRVTRGISVESSNIVVFSGSMQGIAILIQLLVNERDAVVVEDPSYHGIRMGVQACGGDILRGELDSDGVIPEDWNAKVLFVTPSRQFPTGAVLTLERRREILKWAQRHKGVIIEDDYDSEFRFGGRPIEPLKALDQEGRVVYLGSFSKTMFAGLRIGYAILPNSLVEPVIQAKALYDPITPGLLEQRALAYFMNHGHYKRHLRRMTRVYRVRHDTLCDLMSQHLSEIFQLVPSDAGLHIYTKWQRSAEEYEAFIDAAKLRNVEFRDASFYGIFPGPLAACFGFAHLDEDQMIEGINRLAKAWQDVQQLFE
ncbi:PLP-dependent aminotransferase family protein [Paenibacillus crassostreae]|uniref:GntR family transcriptional regulator n=1 Tax=Paenibacillus crassostreae TaxID=1763538 RepID=A0A167GGC2_9BACL|nr:PLP-dependent aminotransferase family protein [Paenibacillus crassostreae]AOZ91971.1 GntR family transcriptional regulator [Paenibacillus crassostreae]OAB77546.1 GntR family transcriptional regulator [Paenibacillus crassostreae]